MGASGQPDRKGAPSDARHLNCWPVWRKETVSYPLWFNSACLGPSSSRDGQLDTSNAASHLLELYRLSAEWVATWVGVSAYQVLLTTGATDACDTALIVRNGLPTCMVHSDLAHECTRGSIVCAAELLSTLSGQKIATGEVKISDLFGLEPQVFAIELARRVGAIFGMNRGVFVLEHVTSEDGLLLPLAEISEYLRRTFPGLDLVIDGAQAAGLLRPPASLNRAYFGCFHKYIDGPAGTGFCVLPPELASRAPHRLRATQFWRKPVAGEHLPTTDVAKWEACWRAIEVLITRGSSDDRLATVLQLRRELLHEIPSIYTEHLSGIRPEYLSHIVSLRTPQNDDRSLWHCLVEGGFVTKQLDHGVRVTLHDALPLESLRAFVDLLCRLPRLGALVSP